MPNIRRWYFYIISAVSLQTVTWAVIALLRNLLLAVFDLTLSGFADQADLVALQTAVIIVGVPLFFIHWRWATRSETDLEEADHLRILYLYIMLSAFLLPLIFNATGALEAGLRLLFGFPLSASSPPIYSTVTLVGSIAAVLVLSLFAAAHVRLLREERPFAPPTAVPDTIHRLFLYFFSGFGLILVAFSAADLLGLLLHPVTEGRTVAGSWITGVSQLLVGLVVWLQAWRAAQRLFWAGSPAEEAAPLRKGYLYLVIFLALITFTSNAAILVAGLLRGWFGLKTSGGVTDFLPVLLIAAALGFYHALVLREDAAAAPEAAQQAAIRRLFWYLVAAVGLLAVLIGFGGVISVGLNAATLPGQSLGADALREQMARFLAVLIAGLPLWLIAWRQIQVGISAEPPAGLEARRDPARRFYLYGFLLLATLTFLGCAIFIVYQGLSALLSEPLTRRDLTQLIQAAAFALMAVLVWFYHGRLLRQDNEVLAAALPASATQPRLVLLDDGDGRFTRQLETALGEALPAAIIHAVPLSDAARAALSPGPDQPPTAALLRAADVIIAPWTAVTPYAGPPLPAAELGAAFATSTAHKLLIPFALPDWDWVGVETESMETAVTQAVTAVKQIISGEAVRPRSPLSAGRILLLLLGALLLLFVLLGILGAVLPLAGLD
jgi:hypothetical protein